MFTLCLVQITCGVVQGRYDRRVTASRQPLHDTVGIVTNRVAVRTQSAGRELDAQDDAVASPAVA
ncbi:hypothetical protein D3C76_1718170 [compost metagenome]